jgi:putative tryptophan/tyrosine transport system substrate-binding protein
MQFDRLKRREFITLLGGATAWPLAAWAQQGTMPVVGFVNGQGPREFAHLVTAFHQGLGETGYVEGQNVAIEYRWAEGQETRMSTLIEDLVRLPVAVVVITGSGQGPLAAKAVRSTVPMVVAVGIDPVKSGLVASLNRPGGHITAVSVFTTTMEAKRLDLLHQAFPRPSKKSIKRMVDNIHELTVRTGTWQETTQLVRTSLRKTKLKWRLRAVPCDNATHRIFLNVGPFLA